MWYPRGYDRQYRAARDGGEHPPAAWRYDRDFGPPARRGYDGQYGRALPHGFDVELRARDRFARGYDAPYARRGGGAYGAYDTDFAAGEWWMADPSMMWDPLFGWAGMPPGAPFGPGLGPPPAARWPGRLPPDRSPLYGEGGDRALGRWARRYGHDFERAIRPRTR